MSLTYATLLAALCIASGSACHYGPMNTSINIGSMVDRSEVNEIASRNLIGLLEYVRRLMPVGIANIVPPFEPYVKEFLPPAVFDNPESKLQGSVDLSNLVVSGAQGFTINKIEVQPTAERVDFDITVPEIIADLDYSAINFVYDDHFMFNVSGHVQITLTNLNVEGEMLFQAQAFNPATTYYAVIGLRVNDSVDDVQTDVDACRLPPEIIDEIKDVLFSSVGIASIGQMDEILQHFSVPQIIEFLAGDGKIE